MLLCVMEPSEVTLTDNHFSILHFIALRRYAAFLLCQQTDSRIMKKIKIRYMAGAFLQTLSRVF